MFCCCFLFIFNIYFIIIFNDSWETNYFKIYRTDLRRIFTFPVEFRP